MARYTKTISGNITTLSVGNLATEVETRLPLTFSKTSEPRIPSNSLVKGTTLTAEEIDGNFRALEKKIAEVTRPYNISGGGGAVSADPFFDVINIYSEPFFDAYVKATDPFYLTLPNYETFTDTNYIIPDVPSYVLPMPTKPRTLIRSFNGLPETTCHPSYINIVVPYDSERDIPVGVSYIIDWVGNLVGDTSDQQDADVIRITERNPPEPYGLFNKSSPVQTIAGGTNWKQVAPGYRSTSAIKTDGTLWSWGSNYRGQLGDGTTVDTSSPVQTIAGGTNWKQVSVGLFVASAIKNDGTLWTWGLNSYGQLGDNTTTNRSSPVQTVAGGTNWKQVDIGAYHMQAIKTDGTLWGWGQGSSFILGNNSNLNRSSPVQNILGGTNWKQVSCNEYGSGAVKTDGTLWMWGNGGSGQMGNNSGISNSIPLQTVAGGTNWKQISVGQLQVAAIKTDGTLWQWGRNDNGQLGDGTISERTSPVQNMTSATNWSEVSAGLRTTHAVKTDGTLWSWGQSSRGELGNGDGNNLPKSSPVQTIAGGTNWASVYSKTETVYGIKTDGTLWGWGSNNSGQLGRYEQELIGMITFPKNLGPQDFNYTLRYRKLTLTKIGPNRWVGTGEMKYRNVL
jgi:alpha-tubulin suppressor-like RCC1 family protein